MLKIENVVLPSPEQWQAIIMGTRNPLNSWARSDSRFIPAMLEDEETYSQRHFEIGQNDLDLMKRLRRSGSDHRKFMRMITVYLDITAPLYWWKEFSTYKVGTVANSCSTMHCIHKKEFTLEDFSCEHLDADLEDDKGIIPWNDLYMVNDVEGTSTYMSNKNLMSLIIEVLNFYRYKYNATKDKKYWWQMIQLLPSSYNQKRTVMCNYEVLCNMYKSRRNHKLDCWHTLCDWMETLPYSELITGEKE